MDAEALPDAEWDLEIDHSEMQRLVAALTADKARVALRGSAARGAGYDVFLFFPARGGQRRCRKRALLTEKEPCENATQQAVLGRYK